MCLVFAQVATLFPFAARSEIGGKGRYLTSPCTPA